jgi:hypothetical protein
MCQPKRLAFLFFMHERQKLAFVSACIKTKNNALWRIAFCICSFDMPLGSAQLIQALPHPPQDCESCGTSPKKFLINSTLPQDCKSCETTLQTSLINPSPAGLQILRNEPKKLPCLIPFPRRIANPAEQTLKLS